MNFDWNEGILETSRNDASETERNIYKIFAVVGVATILRLVFSAKTLHNDV